MHVGHVHITDGSSTTDNLNADLYYQKPTRANKKIIN